MSKLTIQQQTLIIHDCFWKCGNCGADVYPEDKRHVRRAPHHASANRQGKPCGVEWKYLAAYYDIYETAARNTRPDLEWIGSVWVWDREKSDTRQVG